MISLRKSCSQIMCHPFGGHFSGDPSYVIFWLVPPPIVYDIIYACRSGLQIYYAIGVEFALYSTTKDLQTCDDKQ